MAATVLLLLLLCKDINWKPGGSCGAVPPSSLQRYQPLCFLFYFLFFFCFPSLFGFVSSLCHRSSPLFFLKKSLCLFPLSLFSLPFLHPFLSKKKNPLSPSFGFSSPFVFCIRAIFIGAGGARSTLPCPIISWGVRPSLHLFTTPGVTSNGGVACRTRPLCFLIMKRCGWRPVLALI